MMEVRTVNVILIVFDDSILTTQNLSFLGRFPALISSQNLPTLPFSILQRLLTSHPVGTATGAGIRQTALNIGVVHLLLTCLGLLSHHKPRKTDSRHMATMEALKAFNAK